MINNNSKVDQSPSIEENEIINMLKSFRPVPSFSLTRKMGKAPWNLKPKLFKYAFQISISIGIILILVLVNPATQPIISPTNTPTQTHTSNPENVSTPDQYATPAPPNISPSSTPMG